MGCGGGWTGGVWTACERTGGRLESGGGEARTSGVMVDARWMHRCGGWMDGWCGEVGAKDVMKG